MTSKASSPEQYLKEISSEQVPAVLRLRDVILKNIPKGFQETMQYGMLSYVVPHSIYPAGYHCKPTEPLPFISLAAQKNSINLYHMGIYAQPDLEKWFKESYAKQSKVKLDMGKSCIRFKKMEHIPFELIAELVQKMSVQEWISLYEKNLKK